MAKLFVYGTVQGVGFRPTVHRVATRLGLRGYVRNNGSNVEICIPGGKEEAEAFLAELRRALPPLAQIDSYEVKQGEPEGEGFTIVQSSEGPRLGVIPADTAVCPECQREFHDPTNRRYHHPFTNCTDCGARFTVIRDLPYDRPLTSMAPFPMCGECEAEYRDPASRRFHAQTTNCPRCSPRYSLLGRKGDALRGDPFPEFAKRVAEGQLGVIKGWGGMHIVCLPERAQELRVRYSRPAKPFALMARDLEAARRLAVIDRDEEAVLTGPMRPIVLLRKRDPDSLGGVSPGLGNVGIMLPYSPAHLLLFSHLREDALVFTSANLPGEPIVTTREQALSLDLDVYLLHDREIVQRADDSVLKVHGGRTLFIRRSRGVVPTPLQAGHDHCVLAVGAQLNVAAAVTVGGRLLLSQYVGDSSKYPTQKFLGESIAHLRRMFGAKRLEAVACDLHPRYSTVPLARRWAEEEGVPLLRFQHHHAHAASLLLDAGEGEAVVLAIDGLGYGPDGSMWGGEVLRADLRGYDRLAHLEELPMPGGEAAIEDPRRLVWAAHRLLDREVPERFATAEESEVWEKLLPRAPRTSGMGRFLDTVSVYLGASGRMTYDGEPAMRLETLLEKGKDRPKWGFETERTTSGRVGVLSVLDALFDLTLRTKKDRCDAAASAVGAVVSGLVDAATEAASDRGLPVGVTGGVVYSMPILDRIEARVGASGSRLLMHSRLPPGDGGISAGQSVLAGRSLG